MNTICEQISFISEERKQNERKNEKGYLLPEEIEPLVIEELNNRFWIDPLDENPDPNQVNTHDKAFKKLNQLKHRYEELSKDIPC